MDAGDDNRSMAAKLDRKIALTAAGILIFRAISLCRRPLWFDEIFTLWIARQPGARILQRLRMDSGPPLYYFFAMPLVRAGELFRVDPVVRLLSFAALAALFGALRPRFAGGNRFPLLLAASPLIFFYSSEARPYALLAAVSFGLFLAAFRARDGWKSRLAVAVAAGALPWIHYLGILVVGGSTIVCAIRKKWRTLLLQILGASAFLPWLPTALRQPPLSMAWNRETSVSSSLSLLGAFGSWGSLPGYFTAWRTPVPWLGAVLGIGLVVAAARVSVKQEAIQNALAFALFPVGLALVASVFRPVYFPGRTEMATLPVALWAFARAARRSPAANLLTRAAVAAGFLAILMSLLLPPGPFPYRATARFLEKQAGPADLVVAGDSNYLPLRLAKDRAALAPALLGLPSEIQEHPGWFEPLPLSERGAEIERLRTAIAGVAPGNDVFFAIPPDPALRDLAERSLEPGARTVLQPPGGTAILEVRR